MWAQFQSLTFLTLRSKQMFSINCIISINSLGTMRLPYCLGKFYVSVGTVYHSNSGTSERSNLQAGLSKDSSLRPAMLTVFYTIDFCIYLSIISTCPHSFLQILYILNVCVPPKFIC